MRRIAIVQLCNTIDKEANFAVCQRLLREAVAKGARLVCFPENVDYMSEMGASPCGSGGVPHSEPLQGPSAHTVPRFQNLARELGVWVSLGGVHEWVDAQRVRNSHVIIGSTGD
eukprot:RCo007467